MRPITALLPGTFDPVTYGHLDLVRRGARLFDALIVCVGSSRPGTWLAQDERAALIRPLVADLATVTVEPFDGLLVEHARRRGATVLLRGVRTVRDYEYELEMAVANGRLAPGVETLLMAPSPETAMVSSTLVREVASLGGDVSAWVPPSVLEALTRRASRRP